MLIYQKLWFLGGLAITVAMNGAIVIRTQRNESVKVLESANELDIAQNCDRNP